MVSIEIAKKLLDDNRKRLNDLRKAEEAYIVEIDSVKKQMADLQREIEIYRSGIDEVHREKKELLVVGQALACFIDNGGGLDMLDDEE